MGNLNLYQNISQRGKRFSITVLLFKVIYTAMTYQIFFISNLAFVCLLFQRMLNRLFIRYPVNVFVFTFPRGEAHIKTVLGQLHPSKISLNPKINANSNQVGGRWIFLWGNYPDTQFNISKRKIEVSHNQNNISKIKIELIIIIIIIIIWCE